MDASDKGFGGTAVTSLMMLYPRTDYVVGLDNKYSVSNKTLTGRSLYICGVIGLVITGWIILDKELFWL